MEQSFPVGSGLLFLLFMAGCAAISLASLAFWIWSLVAAIQNPTLDSNARLLWILVIVLAGILGSIIYLVAGHNGSGGTLATKTPPHAPPGKRI